MEACMTAALLPRGCLAALLIFCAASAQAANCPVNRDQLAQALKQSVQPSGGPSNGGADTKPKGGRGDPDGVGCALPLRGAQTPAPGPGRPPPPPPEGETPEAPGLKQAA